jgi:hypothetical protein
VEPASGESARPVLGEPGVDGAAARGFAREGEFLGDDCGQAKALVGLADLRRIDDSDPRSEVRRVVSAVDEDSAGGGAKPAGEREGERGVAGAGFASHQLQLPVPEPK